MGKKKAAACLQKIVLAYVDGYNLYEHCEKALKNGYPPHEKPCYIEVKTKMWYSPKKIIQHFGDFGYREDDVYVKVWYYTSQPLPPRKGGKYRIEHYDHYKSVLKNEGIEVVEGKFIGLLDENKKFEEKQTDVNLAIDMVRHAYQSYQESGDVHKIVLVSKDSDFDPVIKRIMDEAPDKKIMVLLPPPSEPEDNNAKRRVEIDAIAKEAKNPKNIEIKEIDIEEIGGCRLSQAQPLIYSQTKYSHPAPIKYPHPYCGCQLGECKKQKT